MLSIKTGININETITAATVPNIKATPKPPNIGSTTSIAEASKIVIAVKNIGLARVAEEIAIALFFSIPCSFISETAKSISKSEFLELIPINAIKPIKDVAVKKNVS